MTLVKVCGVRRVEDAVRAVDLGATWIGCVLAPDSPRCATVDEAVAIRAAIGERTGVVAVFRGQSTDEVVTAARAAGVERVQLHGASAAELERAEQFGLVVHPVWSLDPAAARLPSFEPAPTVDRPGVLDCGRGGTGRSFDWNLLADGCPAHVYVAGGIGPDNVRDLLRYHPYGIDVSSGIESDPGLKDPMALERLFDAIRSAS